MNILNLNYVKWHTIQQESPTVRYATLAHDNLESSDSITHGNV